MKQLDDTADVFNEAAAWLAQPDSYTMDLT